MFNKRSKSMSIILEAIVTFKTLVTGSIKVLNSHI